MTENSTPATVPELRKFGFLFAGMLILLFEVVLPWLKSHPVPWWPLVIAVPVAVLALIAPAALRPLHTAWLKFGAVMGFINTRIIMTVLFFVVLTPIGWLLRLCGKDPLSRRFDKSVQSYRIQSQSQTKEQLERPY